MKRLSELVGLGPSKLPFGGFEANMIGVYIPPPSHNLSIQIKETVTNVHADENDRDTEQEE